MSLFRKLFQNLEKFGMLEINNEMMAILLLFINNYKDL